MRVADCRLKTNLPPAIFTVAVSALALFYQLLQVYPIIYLILAFCLPYSFVLLIFTFCFIPLFNCMLTTALFPYSGRMRPRSSLSELQPEPSISRAAVRKGRVLYGQPSLGSWLPPSRRPGLSLTPPSPAYMHIGL